MTYRGKKIKEDEKELAGEYDHEMDCCALENSIQDGRNTRISLRHPPSSSENDREGKKI